MKPFKPPPAVATSLLIGLCVVVQVAATIGGSAFDFALAQSWGLVPARITAVLHGAVPVLPAAATLLTSLFVHGGWLHLALNVMFLAWVGRYVEWIVGRRVLVLLFVAGGVAGGLLQIATDPVAPYPVVGASGAIAAIFGAYAVLFARSRASGRRVLGIRVSADAMTALWYAMAWIGLQLLTGLVINEDSGMGRIAIWTHIGGFITGLILIQPWARAPEPPIG